MGERGERSDCHPEQPECRSALGPGLSPQTEGKERKGSKGNSSWGHCWVSVRPLASSFCPHAYVLVCLLVSLGVSFCSFLPGPALEARRAPETTES